MRLGLTPTPGHGRSISALFISRLPVPGSYPFSPRGAPSRRPGGDISARPGSRRPAGPGAGAQATWRRRGGAFGLGEPGQARSTRASPGRTRGAFAAARARVWAAPRAQRPPGGGARRRGRGAGCCLPCPGPAGSVGSAGPLPLAPRTGSRSHSGGRGGRRERTAVAPGRLLEEARRAEALRSGSRGRPRGLVRGAQGMNHPPPQLGPRCPSGRLLPGEVPAPPRRPGAQLGRGLTHRHSFYRFSDLGCPV